MKKLIVTLALTSFACGNMPTNLSVDTRMDVLISTLHSTGSGERALEMYPDLTPVYVDYGQGMEYPEKILPFTYYYSQEENVTVAICNLGLTVLVCPYYIANPPNDSDKMRCHVAETLLRY